MKVGHVRQRTDADLGTRYARHQTLHNNKAQS